MEDLVNIRYGTAGLIGVMGYLVVFLGLFLLMMVVLLLGRIKRQKTEEKREVAPAVPVEPEIRAVQRPEADGEVELYGVHPRDAAVIMAILADRLGKPLQELHFKSIKEVKDQ